MTIPKRDRAEVKKKVLDKFPVAKEEHKCAFEKQTMDRLRAGEAKKIIDLTQQKKIYE